MGISDDFLTERVLVMIPLILSLTVHEWAHAWAAWMLGDDTAKRLGRLTLNPLVHMDPIGTFLLPLMGIPLVGRNLSPSIPSAFRAKLGCPEG